MYTKNDTQCTHKLTHSTHKTTYKIKKLDLFSNFSKIIIGGRRMKTIKIDEESFKILAKCKIETSSKTYSQTIKEILKLNEYWYLKAQEKKQ